MPQLTALESLWAAKAILCPNGALEIRDTERIEARDPRMQVIFSPGVVVRLIERHNGGEREIARAHAASVSEAASALRVQLAAMIRRQLELKEASHADFVAKHRKILEALDAT